jgi:hypothetical protein
LLNLNYAAKSTVADWIHLNSIDYNPTLNQIMLSSHNTNEIWIIDHSTTTTEAAGHSGGNSGKGGDFLYRWGNPQAYNNGAAADKKFFGQHNAHWIEAGLPFENQIMVFNNGVARPGGNYSTIEIINPPVNGFGYTVTLPYLPASNSWIYNAGNPNNFYSMNISGAQQLSNGNVLTCTGDNGTFYEVDNSGKTLWKYVNPVKTTGIINQGTAPTQNMVFRCVYYPADYRGFAGHTLIAGSIIENSNSVSDACNLTLSHSENVMPENSIQIYPNPVNQFLNIDMDVNLDSEIKIEVSDISGRVIHNHSKLDCSNHYMIDVSNYPKGIYFVNILSSKNSLTRKIVIE